MPSRPDAHQSARQVMAHLPEVRQRRRWWPFPVFYRDAKPPTAIHTNDDQPVLISTTNGLSLNAIRRTQIMLSPIKAITAGALVFAIGGAYFLAGAWSSDGESPVGAETADLG